MAQRHLVMLPTGESGLEIHPLKDWLRKHPDYLPEGMDTRANTSHQLRNALRRVGWRVEMTPTEVRLTPPDFDATAYLVDEVLGSPTENFLEDSDEDLGSPYFSLESQLRDFIASNLSSLKINGKQLKLFIDASERDGVEFQTAVGRIDILAIDDAGSFYVFELKRSESADRVLGQLARYMGCIKHTIGQGREVFGIIVSKTISTNLRYAVSVMPNVSLFEYEVQFTLKSAHDLVT